MTPEEKLDIQRKKQRNRMKCYRKIKLPARRRRIIHLLGGRCCKCFKIQPDKFEFTEDKNDVLEVHHIDPLITNNGRGQENRLKEYESAIQTIPTNLAILCVKCHRKRTKEQNK